MHSFFDMCSVVMADLLLRKHRWFQDSVSSPSISEQLRNMTVELPAIENEGFFDVNAHSSADRLDPAFHVAKWLGPQHPCIIYHHGNNESPFNYSMGSKNSFKNILYKHKDSINASLITLRAPFHNLGFKAYFEKMASLSNFTAMLAASVHVIEALVQYLKSSGCPKVIVTGISLGGWVTNLHRSFYNSAHIYAPIFAGAALDQLFLTSYYKKLTSALAHKEAEKLKEALNFEAEFKRIKDENVFPLQARYDQLIELGVQSRCYDQKALKIIDKGHITGALAFGALRSHILSHL